MEHESAYLAQKFSQIRSFRDWTVGRQSPARNPQPSDLPTEYLLPDASNLGLVLGELTFRRQMDRINEQVRKFLPRAEELTTRNVKGKTCLYLRETDNSEPIPAARLSDGTLRFIALIVALYSEPTPSLVCIEEPEIGFHPDAMSIVAKLLMDASEHTQIILTTHSDALLDWLNDREDSVMVFENWGNGTEVERLDAEELSEWLKTYTLGGLWRSGHLGGKL